MLVNDIMTPSPRTVTVDTTVGYAWEILRTLDVRHLPVVNADRELVGIVSDRDFATPPAPALMNELLGRSSASLDAPVASVMTGAPISVDADDDVDEAVNLMIENKVGALPVVGPDGQVVGIVSYLDILRSLRTAT